MAHPPDPARNGPDSVVLSEAEREIVRAVRAIRFGSIEITIHDGRVLQIERREKVRMSAEEVHPRRKDPPHR